MDTQEPQEAQEWMDSEVKIALDLYFNLRLEIVKTFQVLYY